MEITLYHRWYCPWSAKVREFIEGKGLADLIFYEEVDETDATDRLIELNGVEQVPCLVVDGKPILKCKQIISWLDENLVQKQKAVA